MDEINRPTISKAAYLLAGVLRKTAIEDNDKRKLKKAMDVIFEYERQQPKEDILKNKN